MLVSAPLFAAAVLPVVLPVASAVAESVSWGNLRHKQ